MMTADWDAAALMQYRMEPLRKPLVRRVVSSLDLSPGSRGLDAGCGIGLQMLLLAHAVGPRGHVTGLDASASSLEIARELAGQAGLAERVSFRLGSWDQIPYGEGAFDWVWSMDAAGYAPVEPVTTVRELARVIKPGGRLMLGYWSSQCLLPGYPALEARLNASPAGMAPFTADSRPENHFMNTLQWMREAGLEETRAETTIHTVSAPMAAGERNALAELFGMRWGAAEADISSQDWQEYLRLCRPESPDFIVNLPYYCAFFTYSVFSGVVPITSG